MTNNLTDAIIIEVINKGISSLGEAPRETIWFHLEKSFGYDRHKAPENVENFQQILQDIFGTGYGSLDTIFRRYLSEATGKNLTSYTTFAESIRSLREREYQESVSIETATEKPEKVHVSER